MQRISFIVKLAKRVLGSITSLLKESLATCLLVIAPLYLSSLAYATDTIATPAVKVAVAPTAKVAPHIALLLPLKSTDFGSSAEAVLQGILAAEKNLPHLLPVQVYDCSDENADITSLYQQAVANGARAVIGPLTRNSVANLTNFSGITVPTLALNIVDGKSSDKLYYFGLTAVSEARKIARLAASNGLHTAIIVNSGTPLSKRLAQAFAAEWKILGNKISKEIVFHNDFGVFTDLPAEEGNMVFLAADAEDGHLIHPYLNPSLPVYATSQIFNGNSDTLVNFDLGDVHFIDMPWLLQPDHPAVMIFPHANPVLNPDMERLYALGIDAFRLLQIMLSNSFNTSLPLDGVTGRIRLNAYHQFEREPIPALFWQGRGLTPEDIALKKAELEAAQASAASGISAISAPSQ